MILAIPSQNTARLELVLPRIFLDAAIEAHWHSQTENVNATWFAHLYASAKLVSAPSTKGLTETNYARLHVGRLHRAVLADRPLHLPRTAPNGAIGVCILHISRDFQASTLAPSAWINAFAPSFRLHTALAQPGIALIRWFHSEANGSTLRAHLFYDAAWSEFDVLHAPGAEMSRFSHVSPPHVTSAATAIMPREAQHIVDANESATHGRYGRAEIAMGVNAFKRWQQSRFAVLGVGRIGSVLAHTLVRQGASVCLIDDDTVELHNADGDVLPEHDGLRKVDAVVRFLRGVRRPGATLEPHALSALGSRFAAALDRCDALISCVDNPIARAAAAEAAVTLRLPHLDIGTQILANGAEAELRLILPGDGCLHCVGGLGQPFNTLATRLELAKRQHSMENMMGGGERLERDFRDERLGSSRAWGQAAGHLGLRMLEGLYRGEIRESVFQRIEERRGLLQVKEIPRLKAADQCEFCGGIYV